MVVLPSEVVRIRFPLAVVLGVEVEALRVAREAYVGLYRGSYAAVVQVIPIDAVEKRV